MGRLGRYSVTLLRLLVVMTMVRLLVLLTRLIDHDIMSWSTLTVSGFGQISPICLAIYQPYGVNEPGYEP